MHVNYKPSKLVTQPEMSHVVWFVSLNKALVRHASGSRLPLAEMTRLPTVPPRCVAAYGHGGGLAGITCAFGAVLTVGSRAQSLDPSGGGGPEGSGSPLELNRRGSGSGALVTCLGSFYLGSEPNVRTAHTHNQSRHLLSSL